MNSFIIITIIVFIQNGKSLSISIQRTLLKCLTEIVRLNYYDCWRMCALQIFIDALEMIACDVCVSGVYMFAMWKTRPGVDKWCSAIIFIIQLLWWNAITNEFSRVISRRIISSFQGVHGRFSPLFHRLPHTLLWIMYGSSAVQVEFIVLFDLRHGLNEYKQTHSSILCVVYLYIYTWADEQMTASARVSVSLSLCVCVLIHSRRTK